MRIYKETDSQLSHRRDLTQMYFDAYEVCKSRALERGDAEHVKFFGEKASEQRRILDKCDRPRVIIKYEIYGLLCQIII